MMRRRNDEQSVHIKSFSRPKIHSNDEDLQEYGINPGNDSNLLIVFYVQIMPDDFVMQLHR
ncbi:hypothetical protein OFN18_04215, partial [Escherichia coli]|nr:hypothetical protein [Escherichia coli]